MDNDAIITKHNRSFSKKTTVFWFSPKDRQEIKNMLNDARASENAKTIFKLKTLRDKLRNDEDRIGIDLAIKELEVK